MNPWAIAWQILAALPGAVSLVRSTLEALHTREGLDPSTARDLADHATARIVAARKARKG